VAKYFDDQRLSINKNRNIAAYKVSLLAQRGNALRQSKINTLEDFCKNLSNFSKMDWECNSLRNVTSFIYKLVKNAKHRARKSLT